MKALNSTQILRPGRWCQGYSFSRQDRKIIHRELLGQFKKCLGFNLNFSLNDLADIAAVLYEDGVDGPAYTRLRLKWSGNDLVQQIKARSADPNLRKLFALSWAYAALFIKGDRSPYQRASRTTLSLSQRLLGGFAKQTLVVAAGAMGGAWLDVWQPNYGELVLLDNNPFVTEFLKYYSGLRGKDNAKIICQDFFEYDLAENQEPYQVVQIGYFLTYFNYAQQQQIINRALNLVAKGKESGILIIAGAVNSYHQAVIAEFVRLIDPLRQLRLLEQVRLAAPDGAPELVLAFSAS